MSDHHRAREGQLDRRRLVGGLVAVAGTLALTGCDDVLAGTGEAPSGPSAADPDETLLVRAAEGEARLAGTLRSMLRGSPQRLRGRLQRTLAVHEAHLRLVAPDGEPRVTIPEGSALVGLAASEEALSRLHADLAARAASGPFARVLAGMAASCAQQADLWRDRP